MKEVKPSKRPLIYYCIIVMLIMLVLNAVVFPMVMEAQVREVGYSDFLTMLDDGKIKEVAKDDNQITFSAEGDDGDLSYYKTGVWPDDGLTQKLRDAGVEFSSEITAESSPLLSFLLTWIVPILLFSFLGKLLMAKMGGGMGGAANALQLGKSNAKIYVEAQTGKTFADVAGQDEAKEALSEIIDFLHDPAKYSEIGAKLPKGALLVGPPGTGKTLLAKAVAGEAKVPFFSISGSEFVEMFVGMGAAKVRDLFTQANEKAPCIEFS